LIDRERVKAILISVIRLLIPINNFLNLNTKAK